MRQIPDFALAFLPSRFIDQYVILTRGKVPGCSNLYGLLGHAVTWTPELWRGAERYLCGRLSLSQTYLLVTMFTWSEEKPTSSSLSKRTIRSCSPAIAHAILLGVFDLALVRTGSAERYVKTEAALVHFSPARPRRHHPRLLWSTDWADLPGRSPQEEPSPGRRPVPSRTNRAEHPTPSRARPVWSRTTSSISPAG